MRNYLSLLSKVIEEGEEISKITTLDGGVELLRFVGGQLTFDLFEGFPIVTTRKVDFPTVAAELRWHLSGSTDIKDLRDRLPPGTKTSWDSSAEPSVCQFLGRPEGQLGPSYGHQWRNAGASCSPSSLGAIIRSNRKINVGYLDNGRDQIARLVKRLLTGERSPTIINCWNARESVQLSRAPRHLSLQFLNKGDGRLDCVAFNGGSDVFRETPEDVAFYALLLALIAKHSGKTPGKLVVQFSSLTIRPEDVPAAKAQLKRHPKLKPRLVLKSSRSSNRPLPLSAQEDVSIELRAYEYYKNSIPAETVG